MEYSAHSGGFWITMKRKLIAGAILLLLLTVLAGLSMAEEAAATPTDLTETEAEPVAETEPTGETEPAAETEPTAGTEPAADMEPATDTEPETVCAHENVNKIIYFFDSPSYTSLSAATHKVAGPGVVAEVCRDCGTVLKEEPVDYIEENRPHSMKKGVCPLCGYRQETAVVQDLRDAPGERTLVAQSDGSGLLFLTLTEQDLSALESAKVRTLLVRGEHGKAVVAVDVKEIRQEVGREAASFSIEMTEQEDGSLYAGLSLSNAPGRKDELDIEGVTLRFYGEKEPAIKIALVPTDGDRLTETDGVWNENGYWTVPYVSEGDYLLIR